MATAGNGQEYFMIPVWILINPEIPNKYYKGYRINNLEQIFEILKELS